MISYALETSLKQALKNIYGVTSIYDIVNLYTTALRKKHKHNLY